MSNHQNHNRSHSTVYFPSLHPFELVRRTTPTTAMMWASRTNDYRPRSRSHP